MLVPCSNWQNPEEDFAAKTSSNENVPLSRKALIKSLRYPAFGG